MNIAVVILNWNGKHLLEQFLPSVMEHSEGAKIYVADNASTDDSVRYIQEHFPQVHVIQNKVNGGYAKGYNDALKKVEQPILCLLNSDVEVTEDWLRPIEREFADHPETAIIQPKILDFHHKERFEYAGASGGFLDKLGYPFCRGRIFDTIETDRGQYNETSDILWASGACFFIRKDCFTDLNGFDEDYFAHMEEIDLCWRAFNRGYVSKCVPASVVYHVGGATMNKTSSQKVYLNFRNSLFTLVKNAPSPLVPLILKRLLLDGVAAGKFLLELKPKFFFAVLRAHIHFYSGINKFRKKRKQLKQTSDYYHNKSIVYSYYVKRKKIFDCL